MSKDSVVELGFIEKVELWKLRSKFFPSKVGGCPSWLHLASLLPERVLTCEKCELPLVFLVQIYAPITAQEECFHRTIFVFVCRTGSCSIKNVASNFKVFRGQLPRDNKFYSFDPPKEEENGSNSPSASDYMKLCRICGCKGTKVCGNCKKVSYCSKHHQASDWKTCHKNECKEKVLLDDSLVGKGIVFPEYEVELEPEELESEEEKREEDIVKEYEEILKRGQNLDGPGSLDSNDLLKMAAKESDKTFARFRTRIEQYPDQIIRYDQGGTPLYVSSENQPKDVENCQKCDSPRVFEFQIMPQLLVSLKVDCKGESLDWGTILIYTCSKSCQTEEAYVEEVVFKQDYAPSIDFLKQVTPVVNQF